MTKAIPCTPGNPPCLSKKKNNKKEAHSNGIDGSYLDLLMKEKELKRKQKETMRKAYKLKRFDEIDNNFLALHEKENELECMEKGIMNKDNKSKNKEICSGSNDISFLALRKKEIALKRKEREIMKKDKNLKKKIKIFKKKSDARARANLRAAYMMRVARKKLLAAYDSKGKVKYDKSMSHKQKLMNKLQKKGKTNKMRVARSKMFAFHGQKCKVFKRNKNKAHKRKKKSRKARKSHRKQKHSDHQCKLLSKLLPCMVCRREPPRVSCLGRLFGLSNQPRSQSVAKNAPLPFPLSCMAKADKMMRSREMREWTTGGGACQQLALRRPPMPWVAHRWPTLYPPRCPSVKALWKNLGGLCLCIAGVLFWVPCLLCLEICWGCCCNDCC